MVSKSSVAKLFYSNFTVLTDNVTVILLGMSSNYLKLKFNFIQKR